MAFSLYYVHNLVLRMVTTGMQVMYNFKFGIYSFHVRHNLTVDFPRSCVQCCYYFIRQHSASTCCQFTVLTWRPVLTANWRGEVTAVIDERLLLYRMKLTGLLCVCVCVCSLHC